MCTAINDGNLFGRTLDIHKTYGEKVAIITDQNVKNIYGNCLDKYFKNKQIYHYELPSGEDSKCAQKYFEILNIFFKKLKNKRFSKVEYLFCLCSLN